ncbi:hypothetical protein GALMADRAFT_228422 [Galerina marginata CBS 339.88]|uniref:Uncharacterized protein n=1 Tax=Galerina marginata (strain CBS 339.88) TaxID=685588 RepID=A0A067SR11_GALM3|nr:hypothetical protein GALMADRAFT_228422 [Galerina marginata CBS 339.88]
MLEPKDSGRILWLEGCGSPKVSKSRRNRLSVKLIKAVSCEQKSICIPHSFSNGSSRIASKSRSLDLDDGS